MSKKRATGSVSEEHRQMKRDDRLTRVAEEVHKGQAYEKAQKAEHKEQMRRAQAEAGNLVRWRREVVPEDLSAEELRVVELIERIACHPRKVSRRGSFVHGLGGVRTAEELGAVASLDTYQRLVDRGVILLSLKRFDPEDYFLLKAKVPSYWSRQETGDDNGVVTPPKGGKSAKLIPVLEVGK